MKRSSACLAVLCFVGACGGGGSGGSGSTGTGGATATGSGGASVVTGSGGASVVTGSGGAGVVTGSGGASVVTGSGGASVVTGSGGAGVVANSWCGAVQLSAVTTIAAGSTVTVCAGTTVTLAAAASISVSGTLVVNGTAASPVKLVGATATAGSWAGVTVLSGGTLTATYLEVHGAALGINAAAGSTFQIDHLLIDTTSQALNLASSGTLSHGVLHGLGASQPGPAITISSSSPHVVDTLVNQGAYGVVDLIIVDGATSGPVFDHVEVSDSHCAFHANQGSGLTISNSYVHHNAYGIMAIGTTGTVISHSNFQDNSINVGSCVTTASGQLTEDYFQGQPVDVSCGQFRLQNAVTAPYTTDVGPRP